MKIEVNAKLILTVPNPHEGESVEKIAFGIEQCLNELDVFYTPEQLTQVAIRAHFQDAKEIIK